ncbi:hypothetical protein WR25_13917 isoform B [Diploscapter pachys]|uniref:SANT domain-containing protein n=1 Tax=Diploscapter pachys TaxID=2018661 RepID=A0A2A2K5E1_9BILA|nr:hypothetical protein WR25_13917 isoform B [Diploscapter pachys]
MANRGYIDSAQTSGSGNLLRNDVTPANLAGKVAEVFLTAGHAFQKLGDLTLQLHAANDTDESKWSEYEVDKLKDALSQFASELDQISESVQARTTKHIRTDIKRRHMFGDETQLAKKAYNPIPVADSASSLPTAATSKRIITTANRAQTLNQQRQVIAPKRVTSTQSPNLVPVRGTAPPGYHAVTPDQGPLYMRRDYTNID